jgi:predicted aspartyl protease
MRHFILLACLALGPAACAAAPAPRGPGPLAAGCTLTKHAELALRNVRNFMLARVRLNDEDTTLVVDTGADTTTVTPTAVRRLGLKDDVGHSSLLLGVAGRVRSQDVRLRQMTLGDYVLRMDKGVGVGELPAFPGVTPPVSGLLGADVLSRFEVEIDLRAHRMALYSASGCAGYQPWPGAAALRIERPHSNVAFTTAQVDGQGVRALIDTGARTTLVTRRTALTLGVSEAALASDARFSGVGIGPSSIAFRQHRFDEIGVPGDTMRDVTVSVAELRLPGVDMLLGADFLGQRQVWISYSTNRMFLR